MAASSVDGDVKDLSMAPEGMAKIEWAAREMPVLHALLDRFRRDRPLDGYRLSACLHVTSETANLARVLTAGGAEIRLCASNPLSTQDDVAAALVKELNVPTFAIKGEDTDTYYAHIQKTLEHRPHITLDDGADLVSALHKQQNSVIDGVIGGTEETTTGVVRLKSMAEAGKLKYPIIAVNEADTKHLFDNRFGTGQSTLDGITRATNVLWAGKHVVVVGYGWCGRGVAHRARGLGAQVIVTEVNPIKAIEAAMEGFRVMQLSEASAIGDIFITVTGNFHAIDKQHLEAMKDGAILANSGHFDIEVNLDALSEMAESRRTLRPFVEEFTINQGRRLYLLGQGRLINLVAGEGHPSSVMDMSFANQALSVAYLAEEAHKLEPMVYRVPTNLDEEVGKIKLAGMGIAIDSLSKDQIHYLSSWEMGT